MNHRITGAGRSVGTGLVLVLALLAGCTGSNVDTSDDHTANANESSAQWPTLEPAFAPDEDLNARIDALLERMTVEQKVGQMIQPELRAVTPDDVKEYHIGSILNGGGSFPSGEKHAPAEDWLELADGFYQASMDDTDGRLPIPILWATDAVHGHNNVFGATIFPHNIALGATRNAELIRQIAEVTAREVTVTGLDWNFAPTLAVARDARWGRTYEAYSEDPELLRDYAIAMVEGLQGQVDTEEFLGAGRVVATAKHFIADGGTEGGIDRGDATIDEAGLRDIHGPGYFGALEAGVQTVMASFSSWQGEPLHGHRYLLTDVLKDQLGFDGVVVGDWNGHEFVDGCSQDSCAQAVNAGLDIFMAPNNWRALHANTVAQVRSGEIAESRLNDAVRRILLMKHRAGLFDKGLPSSRAYAGEQQLLGAPEHRAVARQAVRESLVLLKNNDQLLPLSANQRVLVAGDGADDIGKQSGGWTLSWQGTGNSREDFPGATSIYEGISETVNAAGGQVELSKEGDYQEKPDVALVVFGENPYAEMQGDRRDLDYASEASSDQDLQLLKKLQAEGIPVVALFITGRPLWVNPELNASDAFVVIWHPGSEGGGVSDVLFRDADGGIAHDFTGTLSFSWPALANQEPMNVNDDDYEPLFPYGFGLSYGDDGELETLSEDSGITEADGSQVLHLFNNRPMAPWALELGDSTRNRLTVTGSEASLPGIRIRSVDRDVQEDSRRVEWLGEGAARVALSANERTDLSAYVSEEKSALVFDYQLEHEPTAAVYLGMNCGEACNAQTEITDFLTSGEPGVWQRMVIDLSCFAGEDTDLSMTLSPFSLATEGELELTLHDIRITPEFEAQVRCP